jgi:hypothetical protein
MFASLASLASVCYTWILGPTPARSRQASILPAVPTSSSTAPVYSSLKVFNRLTPVILVDYDGDINHSLSPPRTAHTSRSTSTSYQLDLLPPSLSLIAALIESFQHRLSERHSSSRPSSCSPPLRTSRTISGTRSISTG